MIAFGHACVIAQKIIMQAIETNGQTGFMKVSGRLLSVQTENNWKVELKFLFYLKFKKIQHNNMQGIANKKSQTKIQLFFIFRI